ncbi:TraR/DksA family transcriptional regulator [Raoultella sp. BIGb0138]|nr:TraR/DksA family transcriptional regulator [Raoultella sp. BIGb0138]
MQERDPEGEMNEYTMSKPLPEEKKQILAMPPEEYMNARQRAFFAALLHDERAQLLEHIAGLKKQLQLADDPGDEGDMAAREETLRLLLRHIERHSRLLLQCDRALQRLKHGEYGYCRETGEAIGLPRLMLRPTAELSVDARARQERLETLYRR